MSKPKSIKAIQYFTPEYLESCKKMSTEQILTFLDDFRHLHEKHMKQIAVEKIARIKKMKF